MTLLLLLACHRPDTADSAAPPDPCAAPSLPDGLVELAWDDGIAATTIDETGWAFDGYVDHYVIAEQPLHEAVRFELERPALVHGFAVTWAGAGEEPVEAGLYGDFGHNGFDFWAPDPLWTGARCPEEGATTYAFDEPVAVSQPGLVYVAHKRSGPVFSMDGTPAADCAPWDACHSSVNLPETETDRHFNGWTFQVPVDYLVRLYVSYPEPPKEPVFVEVPEVTFSGRVAWGDYDGDGWDDAMTGGLKLWRNEGGTFRDVSAEAGLTGIAGEGGVWGDYDNDGCLDFFAAADSYTRADVLLRNTCEGGFTDVTATAGIHDQQTYNACGGDAANDRSPTAAAAWLDVDGDGLLDLYLANMICWSDWTFYKDKLWRNLGDGSFEDWSTGHGVSTQTSSSRGASPADADGDGDVDLLVAAYTLQRNLFYDNVGGGQLEERASAAGLAGTATPYGGGIYYGHTIGAAWGDLDGDGDLDAVAANLAHPRFFHFSDKTQVLINDGEGKFTDITGDFSRPESAAGLRYQETHSSPVLADFDLDGALDLVITAVYDGRPTDFYWGAGDGTFRLAVDEAGITTVNGWGAAAADVDHDGDPDLATYTLFENARGGGHWLQVRAIGDVKSNRAALGATVRVTAGGRTITRHVSGGNGQGCQDSATLVFGLGDASEVDAVEIDFPGGGTVSYPGPFEADRRLWLAESGAVTEGWAPPR